MKEEIRIRYQAAIIKNDQVLLIQHREHAGGRAYWLFPGGGREPGETEIECVQREVWEETNLEVEVLGLLLDEVRTHVKDGRRLRYKTYLCCPLAGEAAPGYEPEPEASEIYAIVAVDWCPINDESAWHTQIAQDPITVAGLRQLRKALQEKQDAR